MKKISLIAILVLAIVVTYFAIPFIYQFIQPQNVSLSFGNLKMVATSKNTLPNVTSVYINISGILINDWGGWLVAVNESKVFKLFKVQESQEVFELNNIVTGKYNQIQIFFGDPVINYTKIENTTQLVETGRTVNNTPIVEIKQVFLPVSRLHVPIVLNRGIVLSQPFEIKPNKTTTLILDFDLSKSFIKENNVWYFNPTINVRTS